jgi:hypothetical protein
MHVIRLRSSDVARGSLEAEDRHMPDEQDQQDERTRVRQRKPQSS